VGSELSNINAPAHDPAPIATDAFPGAFTMNPFGAALAATVALACAPGVGWSQTASDAYTPLALYNGGWDSKSGDGTDKAAATVHLVNHCEKTGRFFVCEQVVNGKSEALVVFLPVGVSGDSLRYRTQGLSAKADKPGDWGNLVIVGERWVYSDDETENGKTTHWRTVNVFTGSDRIHFERQRSADGITWTTVMAGEESRVRQSP
jgi:hypothetical protein